MAKLIDKEKRARALARTIASDLILYNETKVLEGIENDSLFEILDSEIDEGRTHFQGRVTPEIFALNQYEKALVDVLLKSKGHVKSKIW